MDFEFDANKNHANQAKHGIDFIAAQALWEDDNRLEIRREPMMSPGPS